MTTSVVFSAGARYADGSEACWRRGTKAPEQEPPNNLNVANACLPSLAKAILFRSGIEGAEG